MALGTVLLLLGLTVFKVETVTLTEDSTRFLAQQTEQPEQTLVSTVPIKRTIAIPGWPRFLIVSLGAILMLHAVAMQKPG